MNARRLAGLVLLAVLATGCADTSSAPTAPEGRPHADATTVAYVNCPSSLYVGGSGSCYLYTYDGYGNPTYPQFVSWYSTSSAVSVSGGWVTGVQPGGANVYVWADGVYGQSGPVQVYAAPAPSRVEVSPSSATVYVGNTRQYTARLYDQYDNEISGYSFSWSTSNSSVATVSSSGVVSGIGAGSASVTASAAGVSGSAQVAVSQPPAIFVTINGPSSVRSGRSCYWFANVSGGTAPYSYSWSASRGSGYPDGNGYTHSSTASFTLYLTVADATGATMSVSKGVSVSSSAPACVQ